LSPINYSINCVFFLIQNQFSAGFRCCIDQDDCSKQQSCLFLNKDTVVYWYLIQVTCKQILNLFQQHGNP